MTLIDKAEALLPCPFCGGEAELWNAHDNRPAWIACMGRCAVLISKEHATDAEAIAAWNRRAALPARGVGVRDNTLIAEKANDAREVFSSTCDTAKQAIDYLEQLILAALPTDATHVNKTPKSEHEAGNVLTDAAQAREAAQEHRLIAAAKEARDIAIRHAALRDAAKVCAGIRQRIANGPMPEGARFDYEQAILALIGEART